MGHTTIPRPAPFKLWATALLVVVAVAIAVLLASSLSATSVVPPAETAEATTGTTGTTATTGTRPATPPCGLPSTVVQAEGLDPESCATPREPLRITGPR
jgi:hypothetical protein